MNCPDCERLNRMLRETGYGQGQIDAYVAQCEERDKLKELLNKSGFVQHANCPDGVTIFTETKEIAFELVSYFTRLRDEK